MTTNKVKGVFAFAFLIRANPSNLYYPHSIINIRQTYIYAKTEIKLGSAL